jgi:chromosome segregation ATPase
MTDSYDQTPAPIGWLERLDKRFMDHLEAEQQQWQKLHEELTILRTKMDAAERERAETQALLKSMNEQLSEMRGAYKGIQFLAFIATIVAGVATYLGLSH